MASVVARWRRRPCEACRRGRTQRRGRAPCECFRYWELKYRDHTGRWVQRKARTAPRRYSEHARKVALREAAALEAQAARVRAGLEAAPLPPQATVAHLARWYREHGAPHRAPTTRASDASTSRVHLKRGPLAGLRLDEVTTGAVQGYVDVLLAPDGGRRYRPGTVRRVVTLLQRMLRAAQRSGRAEFAGAGAALAAVGEVVVPRGAQRERGYLTPLQAARVLDALPTVQWRSVFACMLLSGLRVGEVQGLRWGDVDLEAGVLRVRRSGPDATTTKGKRARQAPLPPQAQVLLRAHRRAVGDVAATALVFTTLGGRPLDRKQVRSTLRAALCRAGIIDHWEHRCRLCGYVEQAADGRRRRCPTCKRADGKPRVLWPTAVPRRVRVHDLRATAANLWRQSGLDLETIREWLGHADLTTTQRYFRRLPDDVQRAYAQRVVLPASDAHGGLLGDGATTAPEADTGTVEEPRRAGGLRRVAVLGDNLGSQSSED